MRKWRYRIRRIERKARRFKVNKKILAGLCVFLVLAGMVKAFSDEGHPPTALAISNISGAVAKFSEENTMSIIENENASFWNYSTKIAPAGGGASGGSLSSSSAPEPSFPPSIKTFQAALPSDIEGDTNVTISNTGTHKIYFINISGTHVNQGINQSIEPGTNITLPLNISINASGCAVFEDTLRMTSPDHVVTKQVTIRQNGTWVSGGVYYNRTLYRIDSHELVPVPDAKILLSEECAGQKEIRTSSTGIFEIYRPQKEVNVTVIAPGFLADKHARESVTNETSSVHFFLTISKSKVSLLENERLVIGRNSNATFTITTLLPDTVLEDHKEIKETLIDVVLIKEVEEKIFELSEHAQEKINLTEGTQHVSLNITVLPNLPSRDLYLPKLHAKLLTSTDDIIHDKKERIIIGFLEAGLNNSNITITNPTDRTIKGVLLSSKISNERGEELILAFSDNNFNLKAGASKNITFETGEGRGVYNGMIVITGTLPATSDWDEEAADTISIPFFKKFPVHDVSIKARTAPIVSFMKTEIELLLENKENFTENVTILLNSGNYSTKEHVALQPFESRTHMFKFDTSNISKGVRGFALSASIEEDYRPADNQHNISFFVSQDAAPKNVVMLIFDGMGYTYLNDELTPNLAGLQYRGFTSTNMRVRIPSTTQSHSILFTSQNKKNWDWRSLAHTVSLPDNTIFDSAHRKDYLTLGVMGQGDSREVVGKMDAILHDPYNNWEQFKSNLTINGNISNSLTQVFSAYNNLSEYQDQTNSIYVDYDQWTADSISGIIRELAIDQEQNFLLVSNFAGTDHGGHSGPSDYWETLAAADLQAKQVLDTLLETELIENTLLVITADHGMCFREGSYGEYGYHASCSKEEAIRIPFIVLGPGISTRFSDSLSYNDDVFKTLEDFLSLPKQEASTGRVIKEMFSNLSDVGITTVSTPALVPGLETNTKIVVKNHGDSVQKGMLCFNVSNMEKCEHYALNAACEKDFNFSWTPKDSGVFKPRARLLEDDDNLHNNLAEETMYAGIVNDFGVGRSWYSPTNESYDNETMKVLLTVELCNHGTLAADEKVGMQIWTDDCSESWCNKTYNKQFSASPGNCNKYKSDLAFGLKAGLQTIHYKLFNVSDMNLDNDYRTLTTHVQPIENQNTLESVHDLGISNITIEPDTVNPLKTKIKVVVKNYGGFEETGLELLRTIDSEEKTYGPYTSKIKTRLTKTYSKTFSELGEHSITFEIIGYSAFDVDFEESNNIKTINFNLTGNG